MTNIAPAVWASHNSPGVAAPGTARMSNSCASCIKPSGLTGESAKSAPHSATDGRAVGGCITVPTPSITSLSSCSFRVVKTIAASLLSNVTSSTLAPASANCMPLSINASGSLPRRIPMNPARPIRSRFHSSDNASPILQEVVLPFN